MGTLGGNLVQFVHTFLMWVIAEHLGLSPVLSIVAFAMTLASGNVPQSSARMRVQSYAVWSAVVFVLNVVAFLMMGMQVREILVGMPADHIQDALGFATVIVMLVIVVRLGFSISFNRATSAYARLQGRSEPATLKQGILAGWCGMRGLVTLATAFALPVSFPQRDIVVLTAFAVVLATLVIQGLTLSPLIARLGLDRRAAGDGELAALRNHITQAALSKLDGVTETEAEIIRARFRMELEGTAHPRGAAALENYRRVTLLAIAEQRHALERLRITQQVNVDEYNLLLEEIDWCELSVLPASARRIEEI
jgi:CPA1 family monovalent cation:H+ antiporter